MIGIAPSLYDLEGNSPEPGIGPAPPEPIIDLVHLARQSLGDQALELELLEMFERHSARIVAQLSQTKAGDFKPRGDLAHGLKGSALAIGAGRVARTAARFESLCAGSRPERELAPALAELGEAVAEARNAIVKLIA